MRIGLISDTHDNLPKLEKAIKVFNRKKVSFVFHAGDYVAPFSILPFKKLKCEYLGVFGNNDGEKNGLSRVSEGRIKEGFIDLEIGSKRITLIHDISELDLKDKKYDLIIYGHTHIPEIKIKNSSLMVNPGECSGWLYRKPTIAIVDLADFSVKILRI